jgi:hypothetical protein
MRRFARVFAAAYTDPIAEGTAPSRDESDITLRIQEMD